MRRLHPQFVVPLSALILTSATARAHHGRDFLVVQDYALPSPLHGNLIGNFSWEREGSDNEFLFEPGVIVGLAPRLALEVTSSFIDAEEDWEYASIDPTLHIQLTGPTSTFPVRIGLSAGYQFGELGEESHSDEPASGPTETEDHGHHEAHEHDEAAHDHAPAEDHHSHDGIHRHGEDLFHARLILESDFTSSLKGVVNLISVVPREGDAAWGYSAGLRYALNHGVAIGTEVIGDFDRHGSHELFAAGYFSPTHSVSIKLGAGAGLTDESPDFSVRTGLVWRF